MTPEFAAFLASPDDYFVTVWAVEFCGFCACEYGAVAAGADGCLYRSCGFGCGAHGEVFLCEFGFV